ncbi:related to ergot alkaloid biosynthetic protein A [Armillaria ostoyae]|uniref:Related to ergot alkaloid biosynthetic protein A n=1 Tax=Armillaria ostoyae TaxID=47428 RepID=A0A284R1C3_ARMOS|nr:related to ergot alkaloid biosynthetic protein A [Armillaria ostoyae]
MTVLITGGKGKTASRLARLLKDGNKPFLVAVEILQTSFPAVDSIGGPAAGKVHEYLAGIGVDYCVLRPTWFMENFSEHHRKPIKPEDKIYSATGDGKVPFVSAEDIAAVAFRALVDPQSHNTDHFIRGPELLSYDEVAEILTGILGRKITHVKLTQSEMANLFTEATGMPKEYADMLALADVQIAKGVEETLDDTVLTITGRSPIQFSTFAKSVKHVWE